MSSTEKYFKFFKNFTRDYSKLVLSSFYKGSLIKDLITEYINIRYYNLYEQKNKNSSKNIQYYMELKCKKLTDIYDKDMISKSLYFIWYITYLDNINKYTWEYFKVLEPDFPTWLIPYINTPVMLKQQYISTMCGKNYTKLFNIDYYY